MADEASILAAKPGPDDPLGQLAACHRKLEARLDALAEVAAALRAGVPAERRQATAEALGAAIAHFDGAGRWHLADEEVSLLPRLLAADPDAAEAVAALAPDHEAIEAGWEDIKPALEALRDAVAAGEPTPKAWLHRLEAQLPGYTALYRRHHAAEETTIMPRVRAALDAETLSAIGAEMQARRGGDRRD